MLNPAPLSVLLVVLAALPAVAEPFVIYAAGDIAECRGRPADESDAARTSRLVPPGAPVLMLGDAAYPQATAETLASCYEPTWGVHRASTWAVPGNHDYVDGRVADFQAYFGAGADGATRFARRLGGWLVVGLDSQLTGESLDRQYDWLAETLRQHADAACILAAWHQPLFSSGFHRGSGRKLQRFWALLDSSRADLVLSGHEHFYEAFEPLDVDGHKVDEGLRQFVVGTGGARLFGFWRPPYRSRARIESHGVLELTLDLLSYSWRFIDVNGALRDAGAAACRAGKPAGPDS